MTSPSRAAAAALLLLLLLPLPNATASNMNGGPYKVANAPTYSGTYSDDGGDDGMEYFDVYSDPIRTQYGEVYWRMQDPVVLPDDIKERFDGKVMAIVGYEVDQVRTSGEEEEGEDIPVPITWAYNHHYGAWINGKKAQLVKTKGGRRPGYMNHGSDEYWTSVLVAGEDEDDDPDPDPNSSDVPLSQFFSEGNGGEFRRSYHGYPKGYAQLIDSPQTFQCVPMQIDTWNRNMVGTQFLPGPLPQSSKIPDSAGYSGLIECPCSDRLPIEWGMTYALSTTSSDDKCEAPVQNATECFSAAKQVVQAEEYVEEKIADPSQPSGCYVRPHGDGGVDVVWNAAQQGGPSYPPPPAAVVESSPPRGVVVAYSQTQNVNTTVALSPEGATITMVGPSDKWFGVGFGSDSMCLHMEADECPAGGPYAIIVIGDDDGVVERKLAYHGPGTILDRSVVVKSNEVVEGGIRRVVLTRPLVGPTSDHYAFDPAASTVKIIAAKGCDMTFAQHCGHGPSELNFLPVDVPTGICQSGISGSIGGNKFNNKRCAAYPTGDLATQHNPTCEVQTYRGGLSCCRHGQSLLDQGQENPWEGQYLEYRLKFRFYFEEYRPATGSGSSEADAAVAAVPPSHRHLVRLYWQTEAFAGEYDIVPCDKGVPPSQCVQVITSRWKVRDMLRDCPTRPDASWCTGKGSTDPDVTSGVEIIYAGPHCHAPTCLSMELYNADTGRLLCRVEPLRGQGSDEEVYDERGFLAIPPCLWGDAPEGLSPPELLMLDTNLLSIKRNNNTLGHTGEMASWQMRGVVVPNEKKRIHPAGKDDSSMTSTEPASTAERRDQLRGGRDGD